ncbi:MAG: ABC transporter ATP-binding protein [Cetobacterium sp.]|uniref:ABC transporter ATP-binding protein n=1 Tax=Cetobacterium sp. TaxID=2071632 RepID=UPI003F2F3734
MSKIILKNLNKTFNLGTKAVSDVNLEIFDGEFFTFLGPSGCGKTTILRLIAGFLECDSHSEILFDDKNITNEPIEKRGLGIVFQNYALFPHMNVFENIAYGLKLKKIEKKDIEKKVIQVLNIVKMKEHIRKDINELSGGQQQRIAIARAIAMEPKVLLLDEPFSNLDAKLKEDLLLEIKNIQKKLKITTIFVTHDQTEAMLTSDRIAIFDKGNCIQVGTPREIYNSPKNTFVANFIGKINIFKLDDFKSIFKLESLQTEIINVKNTTKYIALRPEKINISLEQPQNKLSAKGTLLNKEFAGSYELLKIKVGENYVNVVDSLLSDKIAEGEDIYLNVFENNCLCLGD